jgi:uncharacterized protein YndB with AHSA1/START domain
VFRAWTDPAHLGAWWGPHGFTTTTHEFALEVGGQWGSASVWWHTMHGPDGTDYPNRVRYTAVAPGERLEYTQDDDGASDRPPFRVVVTFEDRPGGTLLTLRMRWDTAEQCAAVEEKYGAVEGGRQTLGRLAEYLDADPGEVVSRRLFAAPRELVWRATTSPEHIPKWWGPHGSTATVHELDFRVGGRWRFTDRTADGSEHPFRGKYRLIRPPEKLEQTFAYDVPGFGDQPVVETATYEAVAGGTLLTVTIRHASRAARDGHLASGMGAGSAQSHDRLAELLATMT